MNVKEYEQRNQGGMIMSGSIWEDTVHQYVRMSMWEKVSSCMDEQVLCSAQIQDDEGDGETWNERMSEWVLKKGINDDYVWKTLGVDDDDVRWVD